MTISMFSIYPMFSIFYLRKIMDSRTTKPDIGQMIVVVY